MIYVVVDCDCRVRCPHSSLCPPSVEYYFPAFDSCGVESDIPGVDLTKILPRIRAYSP
jgi:hypothetical protein